MQFVLDTLLVVHQREDRLVGEVLHLLLELALLFLHLLLREVVRQQREAVGLDGLQEDRTEGGD